MSDVTPRGRRTTTVLRSVLSVLALVACSDTGSLTDPTGARATSLAEATALNGGAPKLVISQFYGGGGNSGAPLRNDYVELYNAGTGVATLTGLSVQYASATGTGNFAANGVVALSGTLQPGQYYLIRYASGGAVGEPLPTPDASGNTNFAAGGGKIALVASTTGLACNGGSTPCSPEQRAQIVDLVGYGTANFFEGSAAAPATSNTTAGFRREDGAVDTDVNAPDFVVGAPAPRNTASPIVVGGRPAVIAVTPPNGATEVPLASNATVTFNRAVALADDWFTIQCTTGGARTATVTNAALVYTLDPTADFAANDSCTVTILGDKVRDATTQLPMAADFVFSFSTITPDACTAPATPIGAIQGAGASVALTGVQTIQGVVVGDYEGATPGSRGFYVQDTGDGDPATSDGIFVFDASNSDRVTVGDVVRVTGVAGESASQSQLTLAAGGLRVCAAGSGTVAPTVVSFPVADATSLERYEGMLVRIAQEMVVTDHFSLGRFGEVEVAAGGRLAQPTNVVAPGPAALALQAQNNLRRIIVEDGSQSQNVDPIRFARGGQPLSASNTLRGGDTATGITGVLSGAVLSGIPYRIRVPGSLGGDVTFVAANARPSAAPAVGGSVRVASFNLLNYFNTFGSTACRNGVNGTSSGDCRGADNATEFQRQRAKTLAAILKLNADIVGVNELENDGYGPESAIRDLVNGLNAAGQGTWAFVDADSATGQVNALGTDFIKVALLYRTDRVQPVGVTAVLNNIAFVNGGDGSPRNRPSLAQAFQTPNRARLVVDINHLKSKGGGCDIPDVGDGQGECAVVRARSAELLAAWLASDPTDTGEEDVLILGDLNSYAKENTLAVLESAGYTNLVTRFGGAAAYSYSFEGQWGSLDHALASPTLLAQVTGAADHHINADEPTVLDYNTEFKTPNLQNVLYAPDEFRTSDHDPVVVGLNLRAPAVTYGFAGLLPPVGAGIGNGRTIGRDPQAGSTVPIRFRLGGMFGLDIFAPGWPASRPVQCSDGTPLGPWVPVTVTGGSELHVAPGSGIYQFSWRTDAAWSGGCRQLHLRLADESQATTQIRFN